MPDLLSDMKLDSLVNVEQDEVVSLVELLLTDQAQVYNQEKERAKNSSTPGVKVRSRRQRRKSGRSAKTVNKAKSKSGSSVQKMEQLRVAQDRQQRRKSALLKYQTQKGQQKVSPSSGEAGDAASSKRAKKKEAEKAVNSIEINAALRPTVLGMIDFKPVFDSEKKLTPVGNGIKAKRAARALRVENLIDVDTSSELIGGLDWLSAHISNLTQQQAFLESLDASNIEMFDEALSAFELDPDSVTSASNTEVIYTLLRDYAYSLPACTPRLLETSTREFESDTAKKLPAFPDGSTGDPNKLRNRLTLEQTAIGNLYSYLPEDSEIGLRQLLATVSREMLLSYNKQKNTIENVDMSIYASSRGTASLGFAFCNYFNLKPSAASYKPNKKGMTEANPYGTQNLNGIVFDRKVAGQGIEVYPFEKSELVAATGYKSIDSAPDEIKKLYETADPTAGLGPYSDIMTSWNDAKEIVEELIDTEDLELTASPGSEILELICRDIILNCLDKLPESQNGDQSSASKLDALQIAWLCAAGRDETAFKWLIMYLAFLQDQMTGVSMTGEQTDLAALSYIVKNDDGIKDLIGKPSESSTVTNFFEVPSNRISILPSQKDFENPTTTEKVTIRQEAEAAAGADTSTNSSLQSYFDLSWEEACDHVTMGIRSKLSTTTDATTGQYSQETSVKLDDTKEILMQLSTEGESIFANLLTLLSDVSLLFGNGSYDDLHVTHFTGMTTNKLHCALILSAAKTASMFIDDATATEGQMSATYEVENTIEATLRDTTITKKLASKKFGPFAKPAWKSKDYTKQAPPGMSLKFKYSNIGEIKESLETFLESEEKNYSVLEQISGPIARTFSALDDDHDFSSTFISSLGAFFSSVSDNFTAIVETITSDIDLETEGTQSLNERIRDGLPMSTDMCKMLLNYIRVYDSSDSTYRDIRTLDKSLISSNMSFMASALQKEDFCIPDKLKYMIVGIPSGLLDMTKEEPIDLDLVDRSGDVPSNSDFVVCIEKVDLTRPDLEYVDKEYSFSRNLFMNRIDDSGESAIAYFDTVDDNFTVTESSELSLSTELFSNEQITNAKNDFALKLYSDIFLDLDFFPDAYPQGEQQRTNMLTGSIALPSLTNIDKEQMAFLSGSNIAFDSDDRKIEGFNFYTEGSETLSMEQFKGLDPIAFSVYSYLNSYGTCMSSSTKRDSLKYGTTFERVLAIPFDPTSFEVQIETEAEDAAEINAKNERLTMAEQEVGIGLETSQGVELSNYRVYVTIPDITSEGGAE